MYIIKDWADNRIAPLTTWESFEDAWDFIYENYPEVDYEDFYVVKA